MHLHDNEVPAHPAVLFICGPRQLEGTAGLFQVPVQIADRNQARDSRQYKRGKGLNTPQKITLNLPNTSTICSPLGYREGIKHASAGVPAEERGQTCRT
jgi:hypothetical protein